MEAVNKGEIIHLSNNSFHSALKQRWNIGRGAQPCQGFEPSVEFELKLHNYKR
jgi:hypothetical protein